MNNSAAHTKLVSQLLLACSFEGCRVWKQHVGLFYTEWDAKIHIGVPGMSDIGGILMCQSGKGIYLSIEVKTGSGRLSKEQTMWRNMVISNGGAHFVARDVETFLAKLKEYQQNN